TAQNSVRSQQKSVSPMWSRRDDRSWKGGFVVALSLRLCSRSELGDKAWRYWRTSRMVSQSSSSYKPMKLGLFETGAGDGNAFSDLGGLPARNGSGIGRVHECRSGAAVRGRKALQLHLLRWDAWHWPHQQ